MYICLCKHQSGISKMSIKDFDWVAGGKISLMVHVYEGGSTLQRVLLTKGWKRKWSSDYK